MNNLKESMKKAYCRKTEIETLFNKIKTSNDAISAVCELKMFDIAETIYNNAIKDIKYLIDTFKWEG